MGVDGGVLLVGLAMLVGLIGVVVPVLPGTALILAAGIAWAVLVVEDGVTRWVVVAVLAALFVVGAVLKYALPGRRLQGQLPKRTLLVAGVCAVAGLFVFPPFGLLLGGVGGAYLAEVQRLGPGADAWASTVRVLKAIGVGILAELAAAVLMVGTWVVGLLLV